MTKLSLIVSIFVSIAVYSSEVSKYSGVIQIRGDAAVLVADDGGEYQLRGTDLGSLRQYSGMHVVVSGTTVQPSEEHSRQILYADRIAAGGCGNGALWACRREREPIAVPPF